MTFNKANITFTLTNKCNYRCSYCIQGQLQKEEDFLDLNAFKFIILNIKKQACIAGIKEIDLSIMGGEISIIPETLEYFQYVFDTFQDTDIKLQLQLLTNFSAGIKYYQDLIKICNDNITSVIDITLHEEYTNASTFPKIKEKLEILKEGLIDDTKITFNFLISNDKEQQEHYLYKVAYPYILESQDVFNISTCNITDTNVRKNQIRRCNAMYYNINPDGKILDTCRNIMFQSALKFKFIKKEIICTRECPCEFLEHDFLQLPLKGNEEISND